MPKTKQELPVLATPHEKTKVRDYQIFVAFQTGTKIPELMKKYKLGQARIYRILQQRNNDNVEWTTNLPLKSTQAIHEIIARETWAELEDLRSIKKELREEGDKISAGQFGVKIIDQLMKYDTLLVNGITLNRITKTTMEAKRVIETGRTK